VFDSNGDVHAIVRRCAWTAHIRAYHFLGWRSRYGKLLFSIIWYSYPHDLAIALGNGAIMLTGLVAQMAAKCLKSIEERLDRVDESRSGAARL